MDLPVIAMVRGRLRFLVYAAVVAAIACAALIAVTPAHAATMGHRRLDALRWAERQAGCWYSWGASGPCGWGFDCSGLVMAAYLHAGVALPRTTYGMLGSPKLVQIPASQRRRGDFAFFGTGHVELVTTTGTFGAEMPGTQVGWHHPSTWWHPTMYYRLRW